MLKKLPLQIQKNTTLNNIKEYLIIFLKIMLHINSNNQYIKRDRTIATETTTYNIATETTNIFFFCYAGATNIIATETTNTLRIHIT